MKKLKSRIAIESLFHKGETITEAKETEGGEYCYGWNDKNLFIGEKKSNKVYVFKLELLEDSRRADAFVYRVLKSKVKAQEKFLEENNTSFIVTLLRRCIEETKSVVVA
jgi:hypothetical protein